MSMPLAIGHVDVEDDQVACAIAQLLERLCRARGFRDRWRRPRKAEAESKRLPGDDIANQRNPIVAGCKLKWLHRTLLVLGILVALFAAAVVIGAPQLKGPLLRAITTRTERQIRVDGTFQAHLLSLHPTITATQLSIGNPPWLPPGVTAHVGRLSLIMEWQASIFPLGIHRLEIENATLHLLRDSSGRANWHLHKEGPGKGPPLIRSLSMPHARVELHDDRRHLQFSGTVSAGDADGSVRLPPLRIEGAGQLNGRPASFTIDGDPLAAVRRDRPYHFTLEEHSSATHLVGRGLIQQPFDFRVLQGTFDVAGPNMKDLYFLVGLRLPETRPYRLSGRLARQGRRFVYTDLAAISGNSGVSGTLSVDDSSGRPKVEGELSSQWLRLADFGARAAGRAPEQAQLSALRVPDIPFRLSGMLRSDAVVKVRARVLELGPEVLHSVTAVVSIDRGVLSIEHFRASLANGTLSGDARFDATHDTPRGELNLSAVDVPLDQLKGKNGGEPPFAGLLSGRVQLSGQGKSFHELAAGANGTMTAVVPHGAMRASVAAVASLDLTDALGVLFKTRDETSIRCGVASFAVHNGLVTATFVVDTDKALITGTGGVHMDSETLDLTLRGRPKNIGLVLRSAVSIRGTLAHPEIRLIGRDILAQTGAAVALGVVLTPVAAVLAFLNPGLARNADCALLIAQAKAADAPVQQPATRGK
jgi:AsmA family protein